MILKAVLSRAHKHERFNHFREILSEGTDRSSPTVSLSAMSGCAEDQQSLSIMKSAATEATSVTNTIQDRTDATGDTPDESLVYWGGATLNVPGESRKEARSMTRPHERSLLTSKDHLSIGCWKVTMYTIEKTATVIKK